MTTMDDTLVPAEDHPKAAPGELNLVRRFVNTRDLERLTDEIADPSGLHDWLVEHDLIEESAELTEADVRHALTLREGLRKLLLANNGDPVDQDAVEHVNAAARAAELQVQIREDGQLVLVPCRAGIDGAIARLLSIVVRAMANGTWPRLKACALHDTCEWAFYDWTKNRSGTWCDMRVCGNRHKARTYRERRKKAEA